VTTWAAAELSEFAAAESLWLAAGHEADVSVEVGMVVVEDRVYVRAFRGPEPQWVRAALSSGTGRVRVRDSLFPVDFRQVKTDLDPAVDDAYASKYGAASPLVATPAARSASLRIDPS
jgi:hypothetical protein